MKSIEMGNIDVRMISRILPCINDENSIILDKKEIINTELGYLPSNIWSSGIIYPYDENLFYDQTLDRQKLIVSPIENKEINNYIYGCDKYAINLDDTNLGEHIASLFELSLIFVRLKDAENLFGTIEKCVCIYLPLHMIKIDCGE